MKARIKSLFTRNIGWKILSIIIAALFWLIAVNIIDPTTKALHRQEITNRKIIEHIFDSLLTTIAHTHGVPQNLFLTGKCRFNRLH